MKQIFKILFIVILMHLCIDVQAIERVNIVNKNKTIELYEIKEEEIVTTLIYFNENSDKKVFEEEKEEEKEEIEVIEQPVVVQPKPQPQPQPQPQPEIKIVENDSLKNSVVDYALQFVGNPYVYGGNSLTTGTDCSGFVQLVFANFGKSLPRTTSTQAASGMGVSVENIKPADIVSYGYNGQVTHSALYIGNGQIVHASTPQGGIRIDSLYIMPIITVRRIV